MRKKEMKRGTKRERGCKYQWISNSSQSFENLLSSAVIKHQKYDGDKSTEKKGKDDLCGQRSGHDSTTSPQENNTNAKGWLVRWEKAIQWAFKSNQACKVLWMLSGI